MIKKIVHLCLASFYIDGYSYQENLLPKFHKALGYNVEIISSQQTFDPKGVMTEFPEGERTYINENGIKTTRIDYRSQNSFLRCLRKYKGLYRHLQVAAPDILFVHGCQFGDAGVVARYVREHPGVRMFVDNHADYSNSARGFLSKYLLHRVVWKHSAHQLLPYVEHFWGVLPARVDFLVENYDLPREKCSLLVMGGDDDEVSRASDATKVAETKKRLGFTGDDFVIVTGGKIDEPKRQVLALMDAVAEMDEHIKLLVFGPVVPSLQDEFDKRLTCNRIIHVPWADTSDSYDYFAIADLVVFPGRHSVYWEQAAAMGKPLLIKRWDGTTHVDCGGNVAYTSGDSAAALKADLQALSNPEMLSNMSFAAEMGKKRFLYSEIARRSIELNGEL